MFTLCQLQVQFLCKLIVRLLVAIRPSLSRLFPHLHSVS